ncbi:hypothetical protein Bca52824_021495 [Brassica carinata]|uniref:Importin N-terminal domain-containing protein n=1 Tax=Brassica carinata TaxID=52824 RepID=A0A8X8AS07_BRACI|nr:hypothetical protein Bca52824_021495 [Brassica carinata]
MDMEWNEKTLKFLSQCFLDTQSPIPERRRDAEILLWEAAEQSNYGLALLRLIEEPSIDEQTRQAAAFNFKNHLRSQWLPSGISPIRDSEKEQINKLIVPLTLSSSLLIQSHLSEALTVICKHDFPRHCPACLPELISSLQKAALSGHYATINAILVMANSIFNNFRGPTDDDGFLDIFAPLLQQIFLKTDSLINSGGGGGSVSVRFSS